MKYLLLLLLAGCSVQLESRTKDTAPRPKPKYRAINEFIMDDGCRVRTDGRYWTDGRYQYKTSVALNTWSDECSEPEPYYWEEQIVSAKYK